MGQVAAVWLSEQLRLSTPLAALSGGHLNSPLPLIWPVRPDFAFETHSHHGTVGRFFLVVAPIFSLSRHNHSEKEALIVRHGDGRVLKVAAFEITESPLVRIALNGVHAFSLKPLEQPS
jgi:hypothetical protein